MSEAIENVFITTILISITVVLALTALTVPLPVLWLPIAMVIRAVIGLWWR